MEWHGFKINLLGLAAVITAVGSLWTQVVGHKRKEKRREKSIDESE